MIRFLQMFRSKVIWKLMVINFISMIIVIWLTGVSVKDFACILVGQFDVIGSERQIFFNDTMHYYLLRVSALAVIISIILYYFLTRKVIIPLQRLVRSTKQLNVGRYPELLKIESQDEIGELTKNYNEMITRLKRVEELRNKMVEDMAHELRTPLTNLNGYLEALSKGTIKGDDAIFTALHKESMRITGMVEQLHKLSEKEYDMSLESKRRVDMKALIEECVHLFSLEMEDKNIPIEEMVKPIEVIVDEKAIKQTIINLIQNAIQYRKGLDPIVIKGETKENLFVFSISGEGEKIPPADQELIFERFYRVDQSRNRFSGGTGLGLAIVKELIQDHQGQVGLHSDGRRHTFWFSIPIS